MSPELMQAIQSVRFIAQHIKDADTDNEVSQVVFLLFPIMYIVHSHNI